MSVNFRQCYDLLSLDANADWERLRKNYKHLVQQCHPDRYEQDPDARKNAEARLRELNHAYKVLADYYKSHHRLPFGKVPPKNHDNWQFQSTSGLESRDEEHEAALGRSVFSIPVPMWFFLAVPAGLVLLVWVLVSYFINGDLELEAVVATQEPASHVAMPLTVERESAKELPTFQYGDSEERVLRAQGRPTRKLGDLWFYGDSSVSFHRGHVVGWHIDKDSPLRVAGASPGRKKWLISVGTSMKDVLAIEGEPIVKTRRRWDYGASFIEFEDGRVVGWHSSVLRPLAVSQAAKGSD